MDPHTRWPEAISIKLLSAKTACEALEIFSSVVARCLASYGLVGRWNRVLKDNLHHVIRETPNNWDKQLPYLLFACREMPNSPTDVSPFKLLYVRYARGPLAILKSHGQEKGIYRQLVAQSAADYLQTITICTEKVAEQAVLTAAH
ncbi:reverse transcriptase [Caerostris extrusa]|uniref:Reverse transcriptase n=1 Tax=Caerostris extrusa TaxID=172846 RepID=A0AAV4NNG0_CAEEX|nr:reverse transcriptase [Caerostris extrusa]